MTHKNIISFIRESSVVFLNKFDGLDMNFEDPSTKYNFLLYSCISIIQFEHLQSYLLKKNLL